MAEPEKLSEGVWRIRWTDAAGKRKSHQPFATRKAALAYGVDKEREAPDPSSGITWGEWLPTWITLRRAAKRTNKDDMWVINKWMVPRWGDVELAAITRLDAMKWIAEIGDQANPPTARRVLTHMSGSFNIAIEAGLTTTNPFYRIKTDPIAKGTKRFFTYVEFDAAHAELNEPYATFLLGLVETGMRFSELAGLHWERVDTEQKLIDVPWTLSGGAVEPTKGRNQRGVPLSDRLLAALPPRSIARSCGLVHTPSAGPCHSALVLPAPKGGPMNPHNVLGRHWYPALDAAGVLRGNQHALRHTFASWMIQAGMSLDRIADLLGHSSAEITKIYAHLGGVQINEAREVLNRPRPQENPLSVPLRPGLKIIPGGS